MSRCMRLWTRISVSISESHESSPSFCLLSGPQASGFGKLSKTHVMKKPRPLLRDQQRARSRLAGEPVLGRGSSSRQAKTRDLDHGVRLAVPVAATHVLPSPEFLDDDLLGLELVDDLADDAGSFDGRGADRGAAISPTEEENLGEDELI